VWVVGGGAGAVQCKGKKKLDIKNGVALESDIEYQADVLYIRTSKVFENRD